MAQTKAKPISRKAARLAAFPGLTEREAEQTHVLFLKDGRAFHLPSVLYEHIRQSGFSHGVGWGRAHPAAD